MLFNPPRPPPQHLHHLHSHRGHPQAHGVEDELDGLVEPSVVPGEDGDEGANGGGEASLELP